MARERRETIVSSITRVTCLVMFVGHFSLLAIFIV